jgi:hypothetical protein
MKYCSVVYFWKGRGITQEISCLYRDGEQLVEWRDRLWTEFLEQMAAEGWFLVATVSTVEDLIEGSGIAAYFKRSS